MHKQARERYKAQTPPGYKDQPKGERQSFGDCIGWFQLIKIAKAEGKGIIFVCEDSKEDWWKKASGRTVGIRYALKEEFWTQANQPIHMYDFLGFLRYAKQYLADEIDISNELIQQASRQKELEDEQHRLASQMQLQPSLKLPLLRPPRTRATLRELRRARRRMRTPRRKAEGAMALNVYCSDPAGLLGAIRKAIREREVDTWLMDKDGDFTHSPEQWRYRAWLRPKVRDDLLVFNI